MDDSTIQTPVRKQPAAATDKQRREFESILRDLQMGIVTVDYDGGIVYINGAAQDLLGIDEGRAVRQPILGLVKQPGARNALADAIQNGRDGYSVNTEFTLGEKTVALRSDSTHEVDRLSSIVITLEDVTWKKDVDSRKNTFLALVSHELRTPLTVIRGYLDIFARGMMGELTEGQMESTLVMLEHCTALESLIEDLVRFSDLSRGAVGARPETVVLASFFAQLEQELHTMVADADMTLTLDVSDETLSCWCNRDHLRDAIRHLTDNAVKFAQSGGSVLITVAHFDPADLPPLTRRIIPRDPPTHTRWAAVSVADAGPGIPDDTLQSAFSAFEQRENHLTRKTRGLGIGLPMVKEIVDISGGTLWVDSRGDRGARINFILPLIHPTSART